MHLFDNEPVVAFQARCSGIADITDNEAAELSMHNAVVMIVVGVIDGATHKTLPSGDVIRINNVKVSEAAVARGQMRMELIDMFHLDGGQLTFDYVPEREEPTGIADPDTGEIPAPSLTIVQHKPDPALASFLAEGAR